VRKVIQIKLNGEPRNISPTLTLSQLLSELQVSPQKIAVAKNLEVIVRSELEKTTLQDGDEVEIFQAVGGG
jgi:thiazole synthase